MGPMKTPSDITYSHEELERGRKLFAGDCDFTAGVTSLKNLIPMSLPEIAFAGRSNVGKSSLINALTGRKMLARTSHTPGRTQQLNFFDLGKQMFIVDLPGYGYARAAKTKVAAWNQLIRIYLRGRQTLQRVCLLIDSRHGFKDVDVEIMNMLDEVAVNYMVILTKIDKVKKPELDKCIADIQAELKKRPAAFPVVFKTSSAKSLGIEQVRAELTKFANQ